MAAPMANESRSSDGDCFDGNEHLQLKVNRYNWLTEHPKYIEMKSWELKNSEQIFITLIVYLNLCEAKDWWNVELHPCRELQLAFITGKPRKKGDLRVVLPISSETQLSPKRLKQFLRHICLAALPPSSPSSTNPPPAEADTTPEENTPASLTLAITESGSTIVYYQISDGVVPPSDPPQDDAEELEPSRHSAKHHRKRHKKAGPTGVQETVAEYANEERDDFMEEEL